MKEPSPPLPARNWTGGGEKKKHLKTIKHQDNQERNRSRLKYSVDAKGIEEAKQQIEELGRIEAGGDLSAYDKALENANEKLGEFADKMTDAGSRMRAAFQDNPGLEAFIDDATGAVLTAEELKKKFEQIDDVAEVLNNKMSDLDLGAKWGENLVKTFKRSSTATIRKWTPPTRPRKKRLLRRPGSNSRQRQPWNGWKPGTAAPPGGASYEELRAELEIYIAKLEEARKAGDNVARRTPEEYPTDIGKTYHRCRKGRRTYPAPGPGLIRASDGSGRPHPGNVLFPPWGNSVHSSVRNVHQGGYGAAWLGLAAVSGAYRRHYCLGESF